jgi:hypothetical protein
MRRCRLSNRGTLPDGRGSVSGGAQNTMQARSFFGSRDLSLSLRVCQEITMPSLPVGTCLWGRLQPARDFSPDTADPLKPNAG